LAQKKHILLESLMKKILSFVAAALVCSNVFAAIPVVNNSTPFDKIPVGIKQEIQSNYIEACESIADDVEMGIKHPKITFDKSFLANVDFNGDGLDDFILRSSEVTCEGAYSLFTGNSDGYVDIYFQDKDGNYNYVLNYLLGREGLQLKKTRDGYRFISQYNKSYMMWDKSINKFISYYAPEKRKDIIEMEPQQYD